MLKRLLRTFGIPVLAVTIVAGVVWAAVTYGYNNFKPTTRPFLGATLYANDPSLQVARYAKEHPTEAWAQKLKAVPRTHTLADSQSVSELGSWLKGVDASGALPVVSLNRIPGRGCGNTSIADSYPLSAGEYDVWIQQVIAALGKRKAVIIYEPNALSADCYNAERGRIMNLAVKKLDAAGYTVYIDAGNPTVLSLDEAQDRLLEAGVDRVQGFALNFANFVPTAEVEKYGNELSARLQDRHFVIDTSRNGVPGAPKDQNGPYWFCNPPDVGLGARPITNPGNPLVDAWLWIKNPDLSDGDCGRNDPRTGQFFPEQAKRVALAANPPL